MTLFSWQGGTHKWFAWYPVFVIGQGWVWWETVTRIRVNFGMGVRDTHYYPGDYDQEEEQKIMRQLIEHLALPDELI